MSDLTAEVLCVTHAMGVGQALEALGNILLTRIYFFALAGRRGACLDVARVDVFGARGAAAGAVFAAGFRRAPDARSAPSVASA